jgi:gliding motility-associated-like protein
VIWGDIIAKRPPDRDGDYTDTLRRVFRAIDPDISCDTLKILTFTIIDTAYIKILEFNHDAFCSGDDPNGTIELETNFTAFNWIINWTNKPDVWNSDKDSIFTKYEKDINGGDLDGKNIDITYSGWYYVMGYMDTTLYETLTDLRIVNDCSILMADTIVEDCTLIIPNVITPNGDKINDVLGIKKLNPHRENDLTIYDRWGKNVFHQKNYKCVYRGGQYENDAEAFDGKSRGGGDLPEGTYYYAFKYDAISKAKTYTGTILILR